MNHASDRTITDKIRYVGVDDLTLDLFEGQYAVPRGMSYNSYVILDQKVAVLDTVDRRFTDEWLGNVAAALQGRLPDYLVVLHMEPDHSSGIVAFMNAYPQATVVSSSKAFVMMKNFFGNDFQNRRIVVADCDKLALGERSLTFLTAPMVHWPEVTVAYDDSDKVLFSADAFGKFGARNADEEWTDEARRYYFGIVGKYGVQVAALLKKAAAFKIDAICPLHGPTISDNVASRLALYATWASYRPESEGVVIAYTSVYGNTESAALRLAERLRAEGCPRVAVYDLARTDLSHAVAEAFRYDRLVLATTTYNANLFPHMREFLSHLVERGFANRTVGMIENGSWAPLAAKFMRAALEGCKNLTFTETTVKIFSAPTAENFAQIDALAAELLPPTP